MKPRWSAFALAVLLQGCADFMGPIPEATLTGKQYSAIESILKKNEDDSSPDSDSRLERVRTAGPFEGNGTYFEVQIPSGSYRLYQRFTSKITGSALQAGMELGKEFYFRMSFEDQDAANAYANAFFQELQHVWDKEFRCKTAMDKDRAAYDAHPKCQELQQIPVLGAQ